MNWTPEQWREIERRCRVFGGWWETYCECGADTFTIKTMEFRPDVGSPTRYVHMERCGKHITKHVWHDATEGILNDDPDEVLP